jgi:uncharacterized protein (DUF1778 family)
MAVERTERLNVRIAPEEMAMLEAVAEHAALTASDIVRTLIRQAYADKFGDRPIPEQIATRAALDRLTEDRGTPSLLRAHLREAKKRRSDYDARHSSSFSAALGCERKVLEAVRLCLRRKASAKESEPQVNGAVDRIDELQVLYTT